MFIYNVTVKVDHSIAADWLRWLKEEHIPEVVGTGCFTTATILELLENADEEGLTYAIQYQASTKEDYDRYIDQHAHLLRQKSFDKWGDRFMAFRTLMKIVD
jgi:hypothetical protein